MTTLIEILVSLVASELYMWLPKLSRLLIRWYASHLPLQLGARMQAEWLADLEDIPGNMAKFMFAADLARALPRLNHEYSCPMVPYRFGLGILLRTIDLAASAILILVLAPLLLLIALLVRLKSPGPVLFRQMRIGERAKPFSMLKFRTTHVNADHGIHQAFVTELINATPQASEAEPRALFEIANDPRVTPLGRLLRKTSLDELPQLWNVLRGDMSLVGPLPLEAETHEAAEQEGAELHDTLRMRAYVRPGITGLWQVTSAPQGRTTFKKMIRFDLEWVHKRSLALYLKVILTTPVAVIRDATQKWLKR